MRVQVGHRTDIGRLRERNEDAFLAEAPLFAVADGMGGHRGGNVASAMTLETLADGRLPEQGPLEVLEERILRANQLVMERGEAERALRGMGTTVTAIVTEGDKAHVAHVGDSRAYLLRDGAFQQLTEDHTLVQRMVREGRLQPEEAGHHPQRSILTRALGVEGDLTVDKLTLPLLPGDRILLCTDGLTGMLDEEEIRTVLESEDDPQRACDLLVEAANRNGGEDNITVVALYVLGDDERSGGGSPDTAATRVGAEAPGSGTGAASAGAASSGAGAGSTVAERVWGPAGAPEPVTAAVPSARPQPGRDDGHRQREGWRPGPQDDRGAAEARDDRGADALAPRRGIRWGRVAAWTAGVAVLAAVAIVGIRVYVGHQWYVGESNGRVAIFNGIPATVAGFDLHHVERVTDLDASQVARLRPWSTVRDGIPVTGPADAAGVIRRIRQDLAEASPTPTPTPTPAATTSPGVTTSPGATPSPSAP